MRLPTVAVLSAALALAVPSAASAACATSTPRNANFSDPNPDATNAGQPASQEITQGILQVTDQCNLGFGVVRVNNAAIPFTGQLIQAYLDTDGNPDTGSTQAATKGAEWFIGRNGEEAGAPPRVSKWAGSGFQLASPQPQISSVPAIGEGVFVMKVDALGIAKAATIRMTTYVGTLAGYGWTPGQDLAPNAGQPWAQLVVDYAEPPPAPPPASTPPPSSAPPASSSPVVTTPAPVVAPRPAATTAASSRLPGCKVPVVKNLTPAAARAKLRKARCKLATKLSYARGRGIRRGRVVTTRPGPGKRTEGRVGLIVRKR